MKPAIPAALFTLMLATAPHAQTAEAPLPAEDFQKLMQSTAGAAGEARLPVACGGLFRALNFVAEEGSDTQKGFGKQAEDMAFFATTMRQQETGEDMGPAIEFVAAQLGAVSALYLTRFTRNRQAGQSLLDDVIKENYQYCTGVNNRLNEAMKK